jgi:predicted nicotinamide N-methyase
MFCPSRLAALRARLLARIHRKYATVTETHALGPLRLAFTRIADPNVVLDQVVVAEDRREKLTGQRREGNDLHLPYWAELWDSALGIGQLLAGGQGSGFRVQSGRALNPEPRTLNPSVLDLGCGMGLAGMVAVAMGAQVLLADLEPDALLFARLNTLPWSDRVRARRVNWQTDRLNESFDLIIGSDVLYDKTQWEFLDAFFRAHLHPKGQVLLGEPGRQTGDLFPAWIEPRGWKLHHLEQPVPTRSRPIRIFRLTA